MEILNGVLTGANMLRKSISWWENLEKHLNIGHCFAAKNIKDFVGIGIRIFKERLKLMIREIKNSPLAKGSKKIYIPDEIELEMEKKRNEEGIPISQSIWNDLKKL